MLFQWTIVTMPAYFKILKYEGCLSINGKRFLICSVEWEPSVEVVERPNDNKDRWATNPF